MREIKFRAWDNERSRMTVSPFGYGGSGGFDGVAMFENDLIPLIWMQTHKSRFEIMQYTGLLDKNGVDIYEGDIIQDCEGNTGEVIYIEDHCQFLINMGEGIDFQEIGNWCEIIGNIYENPELLN